MLMFLPLARYFDFDGRSRRSEFWLFMLFQAVVALLFWAVFFALYWHRLWDLVADYLASFGVGSGYGGHGGGAAADGYGFGYRPQHFGFDPRFIPSDLFTVFGPVGIGLLVGYQLFGLVMFVPSLAVTVRRLHDANRSGWWLFAPLLPYLLAAMFVILTFATGFHADSWLMAAAGGFVLVGLVLSVAVFVFMFVGGTVGANRFGPDPKARRAPHAWR